MAYEQNIQVLRTLNLPGLLEAYRQQATTPGAASQTHDEWLSVLLEREAALRSTRRLERLLRGAHFRFPQATIDSLIWHDRPGLERGIVMRLATCEWLRASQIVLIAGKTGTGKTYLSNALGHAACDAGFSVLFTRIGDLCAELELGRADGSFAKRRARLATVDLLILDDWGSGGGLEATERRHLYDILEDRYRRKATMVTSQHPISQWYELLGGDPTMADAIMDRLVHHAHRIELEGESLRRRNLDGPGRPTRGAPKGETHGDDAGGDPMGTAKP